ncbi:bifunctional DNA-formamidopyrimidine glycosylase/DNA-(apurinic or apyrimidinic site) lyase [Glaciecola sp. 1036]|uniref:bifunctional DNA-formamidopyrimidine glycosylase/DNA-(apurinic or apyrimidinic site) lyase n=1 Tax=Alteromonadaceae TaxID=72275 RepID=UPI003D018AAB
MPELPEVEVTRLGISPHVENQVIDKILVHERRMRWPVPVEVHIAEQQAINSVVRRAKYLFLNTSKGSLIFHLGMSGKMRVVDAELARKKHDHIEVYLATGKKLVLNDPRRFGSCLWQGKDEPESKLMSSLGPEPLTDDFDGKRLFDLSRTKKSSVKTFIMDNAVVVGVGNIYANEALFLSGIDPRRQANKISAKRYELLATNIKLVLQKAIQQGGTTLRDFAQADGNPGYFAQQLNVYGRAGEPCVNCLQPIKSLVIGQRNTFFCTSCQR